MKRLVNPPASCAVLDCGGTRNSCSRARPVGRPRSFPSLRTSGPYGRRGAGHSHPDVEPLSGARARSGTGEAVSLSLTMSSTPPSAEHCTDRTPLLILGRARPPRPKRRHGEPAWAPPQAHIGRPRTHIREARRQDSWKAQLYRRRESLGQDPTDQLFPGWARTPAMIVAAASATPPTAAAFLQLNALFITAAPAAGARSARWSAWTEAGP